MKRLALLLLFVTAGCCVIPRKAAVKPISFGDDLDFLKQHTQVVVLSNKAGGMQVVVCPAMQARVMTSTATGLKGLSYGWINRELIASGKTNQHINACGGEDRFWIGPEGGQFSVFFAKGVPFDLEHWFTPAAVDTEPFEVVAQSEDLAQFRKKFSVENYSGTKLDLVVNREVRLLNKPEIWKFLGIEPAKNVDAVGFESANYLTNAGAAPWTKETGLLSIWILGMFNPSPDTTIVVPINPGAEQELGKAVTDDYFGKVPPDRLVARDRAVFFKGDGKYRSKIGFGPKRCRGILGSYDAANKVLTLVQHTFSKDATDYVNSAWKIQDNPYGGDVINSYNDGPATPGAKPMGPFYELESSSPAAALPTGRAIEHVHRTIHLQGKEKDLDRIAQATLGVTLKEITTALP
jgi:hypothetical protein